MSLSILNYLKQPKIALLVLFLVLVVYVILRSYIVRNKRARRQKGPVLLKLDGASAPQEQGEAVPAGEPELAAAEPPAGPSFQTLERPPSASADLLHGALILLAFVVAAGFVLVLIPQGRFDQLAQNIQERRAGAKQEQVAFLYLGDEVKDKDFHIRGVVRNITDQPLENLDAAVRLYAPDGRLMETAMVRMDKETIAPDETAEFHLVYPNYESQIGSYSVDFRWRDGVVVPYKDMRAAARPHD